MSASPLAGVGSALTGATQLAAYVLGLNTTTNSNTSGSSSSSSYANTQVSEEQDINQDVDQIVNQLTSSTTLTSNATNTSSNTTNDVLTNMNTNTTNTVTNQTGTPQVIASLTNLANTALANSTDPTKTQGLLTSILQQAGDAMTSVFGQQKQAGIYSSSAAASQTNDILSRAAADTAQAILGYQTSQQTLADTALNQLLGTYSTTTTNNDVSQIGSVDTTTNNTTSSFTTGETLNQTASLTDTNTDTNTNTTDSAATQVTAGNQSKNQSTTTSKSSSGLSVVCTWMVKNKLLPIRKYFIVSKELASKPWYIQKGYITVAAPLVKILERGHTTKLSRFILAVFGARTEYICATKKVYGCHRSILGWLARAGIAIYCTPSSFYFWLQHIRILPATRSSVDAVIEDFSARIRKVG